jgi:curved DNA-binding protein CbpA
MENWETKWIDYYAFLGLLPTAEVEVVVAVYRRLARKYGVPGGTEPDEAKYRVLNDAKDVLADTKNEWKRRDYDQEHARRTAGTGPPREEANASQANDDLDRPESTTAGPPPGAAADRGSKSDDGTPSGNARRRFLVTVDYDKSIQNMIEECDFDNSYFEQELLHLYVQKGRGKAQLYVELFKPMYDGQNIRSIIGWLDDLEYRIIDLAELLSFTKAYPMQQYNFAILGLGIRATSNSGKELHDAVIYTSDGGGRQAHFFSRAAKQGEVSQFSRIAATKK